MLNIRNGVFETNSSSVHSFIMLNRDIDIPNYPREDSEVIDKETLIVYRSDLYFDRLFNILISPKEKALYALSAFCKKEGILDEILSILKSIYPKLNEIKLCCPLDELLFAIDEQSDGKLAHFLTTNNITLKQFITDNHIVAIIDGDEFCIFEKLQEVGLISNTAIVQKG